MMDIYKSTAKYWPGLEEAQKRDNERLRRWVVKTAKDARASKYVDAEQKELVDFWLEEFEACFDPVAAGEGDKTVRLGMLEAVMTIFAIAPPGTRGLHSKAGHQSAKKRRYASWKQWREQAMLEAKKMVRSGHGKRSEILRKWRVKLDPPYCERVLETTFDRWEKRTQRFIRN